jgi:hypothetical protein
MRQVPLEAGRDPQVAGGVAKKGVDAGLLRGRIPELCQPLRSSRSPTAGVQHQLGRDFVDLAARAARTGADPDAAHVISAPAGQQTDDILATAVPGFPVWDLGDLLGSSLWGLWVLALGVAVLRGPLHRPTTTAAVPARSGTRS